MTRWLRSHAFASNAFASYPLHGPREAAPPDPGPSRNFGWPGVMDVRVEKRPRRRDDEDIMIILANMEE